MTLKNIIFLIIFTLLSVYIAFLNPHEVEVYLTQSFSLHMPMVILLLGFILVGVLVTIVLNWAIKIKSSWGNMKVYFREKQIKKRDQWCASHFEKAENAMAGGNLEKAKVLYNKVLEEFPNHVGALDGKGKIARIQGETDRALELHLKATQIDPGNLKVLTNLADDYSNTGLPVKEIQTLEKIRKVEPDSPAVLSRIRDSYLDKQDWKNASEIQKRVISLTRDKKQQEKEQQLSGQITYQKALQHWEKGQVDSAMSELRKALRSDQKCLPAYITLGDAFLKSGNTKNAIKTWQAGLSHTHSPVCLLRIQKVLQESDNLNDLIKIYQDAIQTSNNSVRDQYVLLLGILHMEKGDVEEAIQVLETDHPDKSMMHSILLANAYQQKQDNPKVEKASKEAFSIVKESLQEMVCVECKTSFAEWSSHCPECKAWDSLSLS